MVRAWAAAVTAYAELVTASNFSFLRGASHPEELVVQAKAIGLDAIAICDANSVAGIVRAHGQAKKEAMRFIVGCRLSLMDGVEIACLPTDRAAYGRLCQLLTTGNRRAPKARCFLWLDDVLRFGDGQMLIALPTASLEQSPAFIDALRALSECRVSRCRTAGRRAGCAALPGIIGACRRDRGATRCHGRLPLSPS